MGGVGVFLSGWERERERDIGKERERDIGRERERERERNGQRERERERERRMGGLLVIIHDSIHGWVVR